MTVIFTERTDMNWIFYFSIIVAVGFSFSQAQARFIKFSEAVNTKTECASGNCGEDTPGGLSPATQVNNRDLRKIANKVKTQAQKDQAILEKQIADYSGSAAVTATIKYAVAKKKQRSTGKCYKFVKNALAAKPGKPIGPGLIPARYDDVFALNARISLKREEHGFTNLLEIPPYDKLLKNNPSAAPIGAVLVYSSGTPCRGASYIRDCGHIEIKTGLPGQNAYVSDFGLTVPISETPGNRTARKKIYKLVSVMVKLGGK